MEGFDLIRHIMSEGIYRFESNMQTLLRMQNLVQKGYVHAEPDYLDESKAHPFHQTGSSNTWPVSMIAFNAKNLALL